jgi:hypothetical protein
MIIENRGQAIAQTDYWDSEHARAGYVFLSWNAGAARLLLPDSQKSMLREMKTAQYVIISRGPWREQGNREAIELLFEDHSDGPFVLHLVAEQCDRLIPEPDQGTGLVVSVWTHGGMKLIVPGRYRTVSAIPCLDPWITQ